MGIAGRQRKHHPITPGRVLKTTTTGLLLVISTAAHADIPPAQTVLGLDSRRFEIAGVATAAEAGRALERAQRGDPAAQAQIGMLYEYGLFLPLDPKQAVEWLAKAADQGLPRAMTELAVLTYLGRGVQQNTDTAIRLFTKAAEQGFAPAQARLGAAYATGEAVPQDWGKAVEWTTKAADQQDPIALRNLGEDYQFGQGVAVDLPRAVALYQRASDLGNARAQYYLGTLYEAGNGVPADPARAFSLYGASARQNDPEGERALGMAYRNAVGTEKDDSASFAWLTRAADHGNGYAQLLCGLKQLSGPGPSTDFAKAARWLASAIKQESALTPQMKAVGGDKIREALATAHLVLGALYAAGLGVPRDTGRASELIGRALPDLDAWLPPAARIALAGPPGMPDEILTTIGQAYETRPPESAVTKAAFDFLYFAAVAGNPNAQFDLGRAYRDGQGTDQDKAAGHAWTLKAAQQGHVAAESLLAFQLRNGTDGVAKDEAESARLARMLAESGNVWGAAFLADLYRTGTGVSADGEQFRFWSRKAAEHGDSHAQADLGYAMLIGYGGPVDRIEAMMWLLCAEQTAPDDYGSPLRLKINANLVHARREMAPDEIAQAETRAAAERARETQTTH
jgi:TPR repeat protein